MKQKIAWGCAALLLLALMIWAFMPTPQEVEVARVTLGRFERAVQEDGKTRLRERYIVSTPLAGRLARIELQQGDTVERGAVVATVWPSAPALLDARARAEQLALQGAMEAALARAQANVARAVAALAQARAELRRSETLARQGFVSPHQQDRDRLSVELRERELDGARQEEDSAGHQLEQARVTLQRFSPNARQAPQRAHDIRAPVTGKVLKILQQSEDIVGAGTALMELGDPRQLEVVLDILTEDATQILQGTPVQLSNWGGAEVLEGRVRRIEPAAFTKVSALGVEEQRVNAIIDISTPATTWQTLGDGFKVDVRVLVQVVERAVKVPVSALFPLGARVGLFVVDNGRARLKEVEVAARNGIDAWVKSGLEPGIEVIVYPDSKLKDGARVSPR